MIEQIKISPAAEHIRISPMQKDSRQSLWHTGLFNNMVYKYEMSHLNQFVQWFHFCIFTVLSTCMIYIRE